MKKSAQVMFAQVRSAAQIAFVPFTPVPEAWAGKWAVIALLPEGQPWEENETPSEEGVPDSCESPP